MKTHILNRANRVLCGLGALALVGAVTWSSRVEAGEKSVRAGKASTPAGKASVLNALNFSDISGTAYTGADLSHHKATVFLFVSCQCPVCNVYMPRVNALAAEYAKQGVAMFAVYPDSHESLLEVTKDVRTRKVAIPVVRDAQCRLTDALGAKMTPEAIVVDAQGVVRYRGRIDDNAIATRVTQHDLAETLTALVNGKDVAHPTQLAFGCAIRRDSKTVAVVAANVPTYAHDVAPILRAKCESCHRAGEVAPFTLNDYKQAKAWSADIKRYTQNGQMPPWKPTPGYGEFKDVAAHTLSDKEKTILASWADNGTPMGKTAELPAPGKFADGWQLGTPDIALQPEKEYHLSADGEDVYRNFIVKTNFPTDVWLRAIECRPGNRRVVHHVINYIDANHLTDKMEGQDKDGEPGFTASGGGPGFAATGFLGGWAPGNDPTDLPTGIGTVLPKGANLIIQVHYHKDGKPETDTTKIGLYFQHGTIEKLARSNFLINFGFKLPYGDDRKEVKASTFISEDSHLMTVMPHMHLLGREMKIWATLPDNTEKQLVWIKDWDFNWQMSYQLKEPVALPKGSRVHLVAYYDNSDKNPRNPNKAHPRDVTWGEQTTDEMCIAFLTYTKDAEKLAIKSDAPLKQSASIK